MRTAAEQALTRTFAGARKKLPGDSAVEVHRVAAFQQFEEHGLPHRRVEEWKYTDLRALMRDAKPLAAPPSPAAKEKAKSAGGAFAGTAARRLVFVDGTFVAELSDVAGLEPGLSITPLSEALALGEPDIVSRLGAPTLADDDAAFRLNTAFMHDGAVIEVAAGAHISQPLHLVFIHASDEAASVYARSVVIVGANASLTLLESHEGPDALDYQMNSALDISLAEGGVLERRRQPGAARLDARRDHRQGGGSARCARREWRCGCAQSALPALRGLGRRPGPQGGDAPCRYAAQRYDACARPCGGRYDQPRALQVSAR
jgi:Fe-S cluster assembly protein SufD